MRLLKRLATIGLNLSNTATPMAMVSFSGTMSTPVQPQLRSLVTVGGPRSLQVMIKLLSSSPCLLRWQPFNLKTGFGNFVQCNKLC